MDEHDWLTAQFEAQRPHLRAVAYRMLGSLPEAEDAVQEGWLHFSRADTIGIENLRGWLTTVVVRICLDMLRSRKSRNQEPLAARVPDPVVTLEEGAATGHFAVGHRQVSRTCRLARDILRGSATGMILLR